jgi:hypothetical protein
MPGACEALRSNLILWYTKPLSGHVIKGADIVVDHETSNLPSGYSLDLVGDPCVTVLRRDDDVIVARFTRNVDPWEIKRTAEEDHLSREL